MTAKVTKTGVLIPKKLLKGVDEVEIRKHNGSIVVRPVAKTDPIYSLGAKPVRCGVTDASEALDEYSTRCPENLLTGTR